MKIIVHMWKFASSSSNKVYETLLYSDGSLSCDCPGWTRRPQRSCKHTRAVECGTANDEATTHVEVGKNIAVVKVENGTPSINQGTFDREFS